MEPALWIVLSSLLSLLAAIIGTVALILRPFKRLRTSGRVFALYGLGLNILTWPIYLWQAPRTNVIQTIYFRAAILSAPGFLAAAVYPWFRLRDRRDFDLVRPPRGGPGAV